MKSDRDIPSVVQSAVTALEETALLVDKKDSGIDAAQIKALRVAIDRLELVLTEKKRNLDASSFTRRFQAAS